MANEKINLASLNIDIQGLLQAAATSKTEIDKIKAALGELKAAGLSTSESFKNLETQLAALTAILQTQEQAIASLESKNKDLGKQLDKTSKKVKNSGKDLNSFGKNVKKVTDEIDDLEDELKDVTGEFEELSENAEDATDAIDELTDSLNQNKKATEDGGSASEKLKSSFKESNELFKDSFNQINIFNGGLGGFITRAQEAGGVGPMVKGAFEGMASGIGGMTKASLSFIATPLGAVIAALAIAIKAVISYFQGTQEGIDKVTAVTRPLQSIFNALMDVFQNVGKLLVDAFSNPVESIQKFATLIKENIVNRFTGLLELIPNLGKAMGLLFKGEFSEAAKVATDAVGKVALGTENITDKVAGAAEETAAFLAEAYKRGQKIDELQKQLDKSLADYTKRNSELTIELDKQNAIADDAGKTYKEREAAGLKAISLAKEQNELIEQRMQQEIELLQLKLQENGLTDQEKAELAEMVAKRDEAIAQHKAGEKALYNKVNSIRNEAQKAEDERRQKALNNEINRQKLELDSFKQLQGSKSKTYAEELTYLEELKNKKIAIAKAEYEASEKTANDKLALDLKVGEITMNNAKEQANVAVENAELKLRQYILNNESLINEDTKLTEALIAQENQRLENIKNQQLQILALEKGTDDQIIADKQARNEALTEADIEYLEQKKAIEDEYAVEEKANKEALVQQEQEEKAMKAATDFEIAKATAADQFAQQQVIEDERHQERLTFLDQQLADKKITEDQYRQLNEIEEKKHSENTKEIEQDKQEFKLGLASSTFGNMSEILGKESAAGKAMAVAQATIDTYQSATSAYKSMAGIPIVGPALGAAAAAAAVVAGIKNVKKITSTKPPKADKSAGTKKPKAEKGALFNIGGKRHSQGGTTFTGEDGTRFEAEQGELIGVMNRNAASHFMAFNNAFPAGGGSASSGNYFESGGIVSRSIATPGVNTDELAAKIAEANQSLPAPRVAVEDIVTEGDSYVQVREGANF